jgi:hypothetical protein
MSHSIPDRMMERGLVATRFGHIHYRRAGVQMEAGRERWQPLQALGAYDLLGRLPQLKVPVHFIMGEQFHYRKHLDALAAHAPDATAEAIAGARFCVAWSHAAHIAARTFALMGV